MVKERYFMIKIDVENIRIFSSTLHFAQKIGKDIILVEFDANFFDDYQLMDPNQPFAGKIAAKVFSEIFEHFYRTPEVILRAGPLKIDIRTFHAMTPVASSSSSITGGGGGGGGGGGAKYHKLSTELTVHTEHFDVYDYHSKEEVTSLVVTMRELAAFMAYCDLLDSSSCDMFFSSGGRAMKLTSKQDYIAVTLILATIEAVLPPSSEEVAAASRPPGPGPALPRLPEEEEEEEEAVVPPKRSSRMHHETREEREEEEGRVADDSSSLPSLSHGTRESSQSRIEVVRSATTQQSKSATTTTAATTTPYERDSSEGGGGGGGGGGGSSSNIEVVSLPSSSTTGVQEKQEEEEGEVVVPVRRQVKQTGSSKPMHARKRLLEDSSSDEEAEW
eukprot:scaffold61_cov180-Ochromonas_danica.AAC.35